MIVMNKNQKKITFFVFCHFRSENDLPTTSNGDDDDRGSQLTSMKKNGTSEKDEIYSTYKNRLFMEEILREFDKSNIGNKVEEVSDEKTRCLAAYCIQK